jgi:hypothetical protein
MDYKSAVTGIITRDYDQIKEVSPDRREAGEYFVTVLRYISWLIDFKCFVQFTRGIAKWCCFECFCSIPLASVSKDYPVHFGHRF